MGWRFHLVGIRDWEFDRASHASYVCMYGKERMGTWKDMGNQPLAPPKEGVCRPQRSDLGL